jgi:hypothetical protein
MHWNIEPAIDPKEIVLHRDDTHESEDGRNEKYGEEPKKTHRKQSTTGLSTKTSALKADVFVEPLKKGNLRM